MALMFRHISRLIRLESEIPHLSDEVVNIGCVYLLVDCSGSMRGLKLDEARRGAIEYAVRAIRDGYSVGLITFSRLAVVALSDTQSIAAVERACSSLGADGPTNLPDALTLATDLLIDRRGHRVIVVVTDGVPDDPAAALRQRDLAVGSGLTVVAIGTDDADKEFLRDLASAEALSVQATTQALADAIARAAGLLPAGQSER